MERLPGKYKWGVMSSRLVITHNLQNKMHNGFRLDYQVHMHNAFSEI